MFNLKLKKIMQTMKTFLLESNDINSNFFQSMILVLAIKKASIKQIFLSLSSIWHFVNTISNFIEVDP